MALSSTLCVCSGSITHILPQNEERAQVEKLFHGQVSFEKYGCRRGLTVLPCRKMTSATIVKTRRGPTITRGMYR
ncbi:hypothetical protein J6590_036445 [Homalodisca vitripennis]|nr:hypothetical protein J6590_036445 [Homalodisca vitripennis]